MAIDLNDTIVAVSSPPVGGSEKAARAIVRLSGAGAWEAAASVVSLERLEVGYHGGVAIPALHVSAGLAGVMLFRGPRSFTGEDVAELHLPASPAIVGMVTELLLGRPGIRMADAGEFSARAFFNQKMDLTQAEGIAATIHAGSELELRAAASLRQGDLYRQMQHFAEEIARAVALVEAGIDFSDEEGVSFIDAATLRGSLRQLVEGLQDLVAHAVRVDRVDALPKVVFVGLPNVGKSSLINVLAGAERSIVSPVAGTTRDMLTAVMRTSRGEVRLIDVPGAEPATDEMRMKMMAARERALLEADLVIEVVADEEKAVAGLSMSSGYGADCYQVQNKVDLLPPEEVVTVSLDPADEGMVLRGEFQLVSAKTGFHVELLREELGCLVYLRGLISPNLPALNQRHRAILQRCKEAVAAAMHLCDDDLFASSPELLASELRRALDLLGQVTGAISPDEILGRIFSTFCIGK